MEIPFLDLDVLIFDLKEKPARQCSRPMHWRRIFSGGRKVAALESTIKAKLEFKIMQSHCQWNRCDWNCAESHWQIASLRDEVIVPSMTWVFYSRAVVMVVSPSLFSGDYRPRWIARLPTGIERLPSKTKAVIPVHLMKDGEYGKAVAKG